MAKKIARMKSLSTNVRYVKARQSSTHLLLTGLWHLAPNATKNIILKRFFKPKFYDLTPLEKQFLENGTSFHIHIHDKDIRCWKWGQGPGILFVHGWNGRGVNFAYFFKSFIDAGYSVITYDAPAHGESEGQVTNYFELSDTVRSFLDFSNGFNIQGIIAYSIGASAVINCMAKDKPSVDAVLIAPALKLKEILFNAFNYHGVPEFVYQSLVADMEKYYGYDVHQDNPDVLAKTISTKMLIVHDKDDRTIPYTDSKTLSDKTDNFYLHTTEGLGHKRILRDNAVIDVITAYLLNEQTKGKMKNVKLSPKEIKMIDHNNIIEEYRNADSEKRIYLFLSHRSLRDEFFEIDQSCTSVELSEKPLKNKFRMCCGDWGQSLISALK
jgi:pimeloyl-ACP methyl ester carboxylesterase